MNEIVFRSQKGNPVTTSLIVAEIFGKNHQHVMEAIRKLTTVENSTVLKMFAESTYTNSQNKKQPMYYMNRDGFSLLVMGFTGEKALNFKIKFIEAFNKMEHELRNAAPAIPQSFAEALRLAAAQQEEIEQKNKIIATQAPKASYAERVLAIDNQLVDIGQAAKLLKLPYGRNKFFDQLRSDGVFFKNRNEPKQEYIDSNYFDVRKEEIPRKEHPSFTVLKILVTPKGLYWLSKKYNGSFETKIPTLNSK